MTGLATVAILKAVMRIGRIKDPFAPARFPPDQRRARKGGRTYILMMFCSWEAALKYLPVIALALAAAATAQSDVETDNALEFELEGYVYLRYTIHGQEAAIPDDEFSLRRAGLKADFSLSDNLQGQLQVETRVDEVSLKDCYAVWSPFPAAELTLGLAKVPFCMNSLAGSWDLYSPEHALCDELLSELAYAGRDLGTILSLSPLEDLRVQAGVSNGNPPEQDPADRELQYTLRAEADLPAGIALGLNGTRLSVGEEDPGAVEGYVSSDPLSAWGADLRWSRALSPRVETGLAGEYLQADNWMEALVLEGEEAPLMKAVWTRGSLTWYPYMAGGIDRVDLSMQYERVDPGGDEVVHQLITPTLGVWPSSTWRIRLSGTTHLLDAEYQDDYTDITLELAAIF